MFGGGGSGGGSKNADKSRKWSMCIFGWTTLYNGRKFD